MRANDTSCIGLLQVQAAGQAFDKNPKNGWTASWACSQYRRRPQALGPVEWRHGSDLLLSGRVRPAVPVRAGNLKWSMIRVL